MSSHTQFLSNIPKLNAIRFLFWCHFFTAVLIPFYVDWGGLRLSQVLILNAWFMLCCFLFEVPTGTVADRFGRKASLLLGSAVAASAPFIYLSDASFGRFLVAEAVMAVAYTLHSGADEALAYDSLLEAGEEGRAKRVLARMESWKLGGIMAAASVGGFIAVRWGLTAPMAAYTAPALLAVLVAVTLREPARHGGDGRPGYWRTLSEGARYFAGHKALLLLAFESAVTHALAWSIIWLYQPFVRAAGIPIEFFGWVSAAGCLAQIGVLANVERIERVLGSKRAFLLAGAAVAGAAFLVLGAASGPAVVVGAVLVSFAFGLTRAPVYSAYMNKYVPSDKRATVLSAASMCRTFGIVIMNPLVGFGADRSLRWTAVAVGAALVLLPLLSRMEESHLGD